MRNKLAGHIEIDRLRRALKSERSRQIGSVTLADHPLERRWHALHGLLGVMLHHKEGKGLDLEELGPIIKAVERAATTILSIEGAVVAAYDSLTDGSLLRLRR